LVRSDFCQFSLLAAYLARGHFRLCEEPTMVAKN
jgi:hypothetical protein